MAGKLAEAYGVYAESGATVNISGKDTDTIKLNITAAGGADSNVNYAIHAANSTVNFLSNATITGETSETWLENAALGFSGSSAGRTVTSDGALKLNGSNTFRFSTDLKIILPIILLLVNWQPAAVQRNNILLSVTTNPSPAVS